MSVFKYDSPVFKKKLLIRTGLVVLVFLIFIGVSLVQVEADKRESFLTTYLFLGGVLLLLLVKNYMRQLKILDGAKVEIDGRLLKQWNAKGQCMEVDLKDLEGIEKDSFRGYDRVLLLTKQGTYIPLLNLENMDEFVSQLEKNSGKQVKVFQEDTRILTWKSLLAFLPSIGAAIAYTTGFWKEKQDAVFIVFVANALLFLLYFPKDRMDTGYSARKRYIFILVVLLVALVVHYMGWI
ncbi:hypothetical protein EHQ27_09325 [Leptospira wolffii]|uniref:hypothetical protein n=1 Tax=Leptospira wolffii TaxID=409998 RepID=UPI000346F3AA|nr:hypothetical protein [Leptospira wolffii]TGK58801.1 hypothetical protein EHQ32_12185 [Leptospira wolffii]TGK72636.1 hypothetical protein EHQ27_09325 [Leptospira wolffii]TGK72709.1 hypothetical protein EHQ35_11255 [Leptospira wolffii]TGL26900.1 hypothetical protein EHQ57_17730 [Leptospira wolffii]